MSYVVRYLERGLELGVGLDGADLLEQAVHLALVVVDLAPQTVLVRGPARRACACACACAPQLPTRGRHSLPGARARAPLAARHVLAHLALAAAALELVGRARAALGSARVRV